jgi:hypothetical protein
MGRLEQDLHDKALFNLCSLEVKAEKRVVDFFGDLATDPRNSSEFRQQAIDKQTDALKRAVDLQVTACQAVRRLVRPKTLLQLLTGR